MIQAFRHLGSWAFAVVLAVLVCAAGCEREDDAEPTGVQPQGGSIGHYQPGADQLPVVYAEAPAATKPAGPLPAGTSCVTAQCHAALTRVTQVHAPVAKHACDSCHDADTGTHKFPLKRDPVATCTYCHSVAGTQKHQHKALEKGCMTCHKPHGSQTKFLLAAPSVGQMCTTCHTMPVDRFAHEAFAKGQCTNCHWPHQSDTNALLRGGSGRDACLNCHDNLKTQLASAKHVHKPASGECRECHLAHSAPFPRLMRTELADGCFRCHEDIRKHVAEAPIQHGAMLSEKQCANCHAGHASDQPHLIRDRMDKVCLTCHDKAIKTADGRQIPNMKPVLTESKVLHGPAKNGSCSGCHDPHGSKNAALLDQAFPTAFYTSFAVEKYELCFKCHDKDMVLQQRTRKLTSFRDGDRNLHFLHVNKAEKGRTCRACHAVHGSDLPNHMASEVSFEGSRWPMPIDYEKSTTGGSCTPGCHETKTYSRERVMPATRGAE